MVDTKTQTITQIPSIYPGLYDPLWPDFDKVRLKEWTGAEVRIHVPYDNSVQDLHQLISKSKLRAHQDYPGAQIVPVTEYLSDDKTKFLLDDAATDEEHVEEYVKQTCWTSLDADRNKIVSYLTSRLKEVGIRARNNTKLEFIRGRGSNFLSFKSIELDYTQKGITVIRGWNDDWKRRSNGSGKTNALQLPAVAITGETFKGQKHDRWARRRSVKKAFAIFECRTQDKKHYKITRVRRPHKLKLHEWTGNGWLDISTGNRKGDTESLIEEKLGITQRTIGAIYIDCARTNLLLSGRDSDRKKILEEFQNLERYAKAQERVKKDHKKVNESIQSITKDLTEIEAIITTKNETRDRIDVKELEPLQEELEVLNAKVKAEQEKLEVFLKKNNENFKKMQVVVNGKEEELDKVHELMGNLSGRIAAGNAALKKVSNLKDKCPVCEQEIQPNQFKKHKADLSQEIADLQEKLTKAMRQRDILNPEITDQREEMECLRDAGMEKQDALNKVKRERDGKKSQYDTVKKFADLKMEIEKEIRKLLTQRAIVQDDLLHQKEDLTFYEYCIESFSRKGLPAFLNALLCPRLNKASQYYSKLFADGEVQVVFETDKDGDFDIKVMNAFGGERIEDQSRGETSTASLITSLAQTVLVTSNILILDEPGDGLDEIGARKLAQGLRTLAPRFGALWIVSHNPAILGELSGERELRIIKENGISRVE